MAPWPGCNGHSAQPTPKVNSRQKTFYDCLLFVTRSRLLPHERQCCSSSFHETDRPTKGDRRERGLIEAAERLLGEGTFEQASVTDLARASRDLAGQLLFLLRLKAALLASVIDQAVEQFNAQIAAQLAPAENRPPALLIQAAVEAAADLWWEHRTVLLASVELGAHIPEVYERTMSNVAVVRAPTVALLRCHGRVPEAADQDESERLVTALILMTERNFYDLMRTNPTRAETATADPTADPDLAASLWMGRVTGRPAGRDVAIHDHSAPRLRPRCCSNATVSSWCCSAPTTARGTTVLLDADPLVRSRGAESTRICQGADRAGIDAVTPARPLAQCAGLGSGI